MKKLNLLEIICDYKRFEIEKEKKILPLESIKKKLKILHFQKKSLKQALLQSSTGIIAEFKRYSPSKGWISENACIKNIVQGYQDVGAAAVSVLTNEIFFKAYMNDFKIARQIVSKIPILRKDFIIDEYQIYQSKIIGADAILLIASCLTQKKIFHYTEIAHHINMEVILEIHNEKELDLIQSNIDIIGINNRNLKTFSTDIKNSIELINKLPKNYIKIAESGISNPKTVTSLRKKGLKGFLIGEYFMKNKNPVESLKKFIYHI